MSKVGGARGSRKSGSPFHDSPTPTSLRTWAAGLLLLLVLVIVAAPWLSRAGRVEALALYAAFGPFCHQSVDRSWLFLGEALPVCTRCLGVYLGACGAALWGLRFSRAALGAAVAGTAGTWLAEFAGVFAVPSGVRFAAGLLLGATVVAAMLEAAAPRWQPRRLIQQS